MPPNRKTDLLHDDVPFVDIRQLKLNDTPTHIPQPKAQEKKTLVETNYWDWPTEDVVEEEEAPKTVALDRDALIAQIQEEERIRQLLTVEAVEKRLERESAQRREQEKDSFASSALGASSDDYWNMPSVTEEIPADIQVGKSTNAEPVTAEPVANSQDSYWTWSSAEFKEKMLQQILDAEKARRLTSVAFYESQLRAVAELPQQVPIVATAESDAYWTF